MSEAFTFRGHLYTLTVNAKGPWMPNARKLFTRRCRGKTTVSSIDETAADMLGRVEVDAAKYEFTLRPMSTLCVHSALLPPLFARRETRCPA